MNKLLLARALASIGNIDHYNPGALAGHIGGYSYPISKAPYGIAKSRRAAKKRNDIRKRK